MWSHLTNKKIQNDYKMFSTKKRIILYFFIIVIIVFIIFNSVFYNIYSSNIKQVMVDECKVNVKKTLDFTNMIVQGMEYTSEVIWSNSFIQQQLNTNQSENSNKYNSDKSFIDTLQNVLAVTVNSSSSIDLFLNSNNKLYTSDYGMYSSLKAEDKNYLLSLQKYDVRFLLTDEYRKKLNFISGRNYEQISLIRPLYDSSGIKCGTLVINFNKFDMKNIIKGNSKSYSMILDKAGNILISIMPDNTSATADQLNNFKRNIIGDSGEGLIKVNNKEYIMVYNTSEYTSWKFVTFVPADTSLKNMQKLRDYILLIFLLMNIITAGVLIILLSRKVYSKIGKLILSMKEVERGNFNINIKHYDRDEFGFMYTSFNNMVNRMKTLFGELYQQKILQKDAELKLLQSKINPHFIYNIFDNMNWLIQLKRYNELESLVDSVSVYFKKSLNSGKDYISVNDTLEQLKSYVIIQQIRFKNRFTCEFDFEDEIMDMVIPNFILQPLLENAICHGIEPKTEKSLIQVKGIKLEERVFFTIEDDGIGIKQDTLENIIKFLESKDVEMDNYFALANINKRIRLYYGDEYGLTIRSTLGAGTKVTVIIPAASEIKPEVG